MIMEAEVGMLIVETIAKIRRAFFVQGKSIKAICRELRVSRKVVREVIRTEATEFRYERDSFSPLRFIRCGSCVRAVPNGSFTLRWPIHSPTPWS